MRKRHVHEPIYVKYQENTKSRYSRNENHLRRAVAAAVDATTWRRLRVSNSPGRWRHTVTRISSTRTSNSLQNEDSTSLRYNTTLCSYTFDYLCKFISDNKINNFQSRHARTPKTLYHICIYNVQPQGARTTRGNTLHYDVYTGERARLTTARQKQ